MNLIEHIRTLAAADPSRVALVRCDIDGMPVEEISRQQLLERIESVASKLYAEGVRAEDRIALATGASIETLLISWAAWSMGASTVPLDTTRDTPEDQRYKRELTGVKLNLESIPENSGAILPPWASNDFHEALILFTSGTTARPKGARLTLHNVAVNARAIAEWLQITENDRFLVLLPLHHINSTTISFAALLSGASIAVVPHYSNSRFWSQAAKSGATLTSVVQTIVFDQLERKPEYELVQKNLKLSRIQIGSAPVIATAAEQFVEGFGIPLYQGYGQTETALRVTGVPMNLAPEAYRSLLRQNSIGTPLSWASVEIQDERGQTLGEGEEGELVVKGPAVMSGYLGGEEAFRDGWFLTGDIGKWQNSGTARFFFLTGRKKEIIIKGGVNISPVAVEDRLQQLCPDIAQAYAVGTPDPRYGEEVAAAIVWKPQMNTRAALRRFKLMLLDTHPNSYDLPQFLAEILPEDLPTTSTGKVQRTVLKDRLKDALRPVTELFRTSHKRFVVIGNRSDFAAASRDLYNHCWQSRRAGRLPDHTLASGPLTMSQKEYGEFLQKYITLAAIDGAGAIDGQIAFSREDGRLTCLSICSAAFTPKIVPAVSTRPTPPQVREYLLAGHDPVMNFHTSQGAELVEVIPNGRPADTSSLGYTMLLRYPRTAETSIDPKAPVSQQLIRAVRILGNDLGAEVYALSRPGGLAHYLARSQP